MWQHNWRLWDVAESSESQFELRLFCHTRWQLAIVPFYSEIMWARHSKEVILSTETMSYGNWRWIFAFQVRSWDQVNQLSWPASSNHWRAFPSGFSFQLWWLLLGLLSFKCCVSTVWFDSCSFGVFHCQILWIIPGTVLLSQQGWPKLKGGVKTLQITKNGYFMSRLCSCRILSFVFFWLSPHCDKQTSLPNFLLCSCVCVMLKMSLYFHVASLQWLAKNSAYVEGVLSAAEN